MYHISNSPGCIIVQCIIFWSMFPIEFEIGIAFGIHVHTVKKD